MNLSNVLNKDLIDVEINDVFDKESLFKKMSKMLFSAGKITSVDEFLNALHERESTGSTYMGMGLAVPHGKSKCVKTAAVAIARFTPFIYEDDSDEKAQVAVMLAIPEGVEQREYIKMLADTASLLADEEFYNVLLTENNTDRIIEAFEKGINNL